MSGVGLGEDGADRGGDHLGVALGYLGQHVTQEMHAAPLPAGAEQHGGDGLLEAGVGIRDDQLQPGQPAGLQRAQKGGPERAVLAVADGEAEHLAPPVAAHAAADNPVAVDALDG